MRRAFLLFLTCALSISAFAQTPAGRPSCAIAVQGQGGFERAETSFRVGSVPKDKKGFLSLVAKVLRENEPALREILLKVNNQAGVDLEFELVRRQLGSELSLEMYNLENTPELQNIAVYASTNVPLYTLVSHGIMAKSLARNVWFRTPETTRQVYTELFATIKRHLPESMLDGLNLLTESRDVQYENFNKMYVMGMNKKGTRLERAPSELVIFTGSPETARRILSQNISKLREDAARLGFSAFKQVFLGFGAGINPIIVLPSAKERMERVVLDTMEPTRINNGQDCLAADFIAVDRKVSDLYVKTLMTEVAKLKGGMNSDPQAGFTPLVMNKNFEQLKEYRKKYEAYLLNPEAVLDENSKSVSPHVFVFPYSMFKRVELREHFAPFYVIFKFDGHDQLNKMMRDERVQEKIMYASVHGGKAASDDLDSTVQLLRETRHSVIVNDSLFGDLHANMPYGGRGINTSMVVNITYDPLTGLQFTTSHRPKLVSLEAFTAFGPPHIQARPRLSSPDFLQQEFQRLLQEASEDPKKQKFSVPSWQTLQEPHLSTQPRGIQILRRLIQRTGLGIVVEEGRMSRKSIEEFKEFYGAEPVLTTRRKSSPMKRHPGVLLHPSSVGQGPVVLNRARGQANPHLGWGNLHGLLNENKYLEYVLTEAVQPGIMAPTESLASLSMAGVVSQRFHQRRNDFIRELNLELQKKGPLSEETQSKLTSQLISMIEMLFNELRTYFPEGAYIKNFGDFGTADMGTQITTFSTPAKMIAEEFMRRFATINGEGSVHHLSLAHTRAQKLISANVWEIGTAFINRLLMQPEEILAQSRVKIAKTPMGYPMEFRVDFVDGEALVSRNRFGHEYLPIENKEAAEVLTQFFAKAPAPFRFISGGADVAKLADGRWVIIEFNVGAESGTLMPEYFTFEYHKLVSALTGEPTAWLKKMEGIYSQGLKAQKQHLKSLKYVRPLFWKSEGFADLSVAEVGRYFRDQYLADWSQNPTQESGRQVLEQIKLLLQDWQNQENIQNLMTSSEHFIKNYRPQKASQ